MFRRLLPYATGNAKHSNPTELSPLQCLPPSHQGFQTSVRSLLLLHASGTRPNRIRKTKSTVLFEQPQVLPADFVVSGWPQRFMHWDPWVHIDDYVVPFSTLLSGNSKNFQLQPNSLLFSAYLLLSLLRVPVCTPFSCFTLPSNKTIAKSIWKKCKLLVLLERQSHLLPKALQQKGTNASHTRAQ